MISKPEVTRLKASNLIKGKLKELKGIVVHATGQSSEDIDEREVKYLSTNSQFGYHYTIDDDGNIYQYAEHDSLLFHVGASRLHGYEDLNDYTLGVALHASEKGAYTEPQIESLFTLLSWLKQELNIPLGWIVGHKEVSPKRKVDPKYLSMDEVRSEVDKRIKESQKVKQKEVQIKQRSTDIKQGVTYAMNTLVLYVPNVRQPIVIDKPYRMQIRGDKIDINLK